ncbi:MAG: riboflavin synthase [Patescibacteria group bacterium]|nr:riboflavin synthase [Patescibacteria group bacterium]MDE1965869.1 riboflavin synthase [Patescibacteria group bacterium]
MFSGIIEQVSSVRSVRKHGRLLRVRFRKPARWRLAKGQSVSVDGICTTVIGSGKDWFDADYMPETLSKTTAASFLEGRAVNLERALTFGAHVNGHFVQGHVEGVAAVVGVADEGKSRRLTLRLPKPLMRYVATKGSIALDGVSLTVARAGALVEVALIPFTLAHTTLKGLAAGDFVNVETDMFAGYAKRTARGKVRGT